MNCIQIFVFLVGFTIGFLLVFSTFSFINDNFKTKKIRPHRPLSQDNLYKLWFNSNGFKSSPISPDELSFTSHNFYLESTFLYDQMKLTCVIFVTSANNVFDIKSTWGKQCNSLHFFSKEAKDYKIPLVKVKNTWRKSSWHQLCKIIQELWYSEHIQWILFAADDVFVIPENLRYLVAYRDAERPYYIGHTSHFWNQLYNSGKTAYVLSRGALRKFIAKFNSSSDCLKSGKYSNNEDYILGKQLSEMGIRPEDTRDELGKPRFHLFTPLQLMSPYEGGELHKFARRSVYPLTLGPECCSRSSVSFKRSNGRNFWFLRYLLTRVRVFNSGHLGNNLTSIRSSLLEAAENFVHESLGNRLNISLITSDAYYMLWKLLIDSPEKFNEKIRKETLLDNSTFFRYITKNSALFSTTPASPMF